MAETQDQDRKAGHATEGVSRVSGSVLPRRAGNGGSQKRVRRAPLLLGPATSPKWLAGEPFPPPIGSG